MPVLTKLNPKIKAPKSASWSSPAQCRSCGTKTAKHFVTTCCVTPSVEKHSSPTTVIQHDLCGPCLVGNDVATDRGRDIGWCFGEVKEYDDSQLKPFLIFFLLDESEEWCELTRTPTEDYLNSLRLYSDEPSKPRSPSIPNGTIDGIGSFSSSSFSTVESVGNTFQLFEDQKLAGYSHATPCDENQQLICQLDPQSLSSIAGDIFGSSIDKDEKVEAQVLSTQNGVKNTKKPKQRKPRSIKMWTPEEDKTLKKLVECSKEPVKWADIGAQHPSRNSKQCRERYINHLSPALKDRKVWSHAEDATLFSLISDRVGNRWTFVSKMLPGRTDNNCKNRFHQLRRKLSREVDRKSEQYPSLVDEHNGAVAKKGKKAVSEESQAVELKTRKILKILAMESKNEIWEQPNGYAHGPFVTINKPVMCRRCSLYMPSRQTGNQMCTTTMWCEACAKTPAFFGNDLLRQLHELRNDDVEK